MMLLHMVLYMLTPMAAGCALGLIMTWAEKSENKDLRAEVTPELTKFCTLENADLRSNADKIAEIFTARRLKLVQKSPDMLVFSFPSYMHRGMDQFVLILVVTFGGALGFVNVFVFSGTWPEKIKIDLAPAS